jgi:addiction module HigA family antidote
MKKIKPIHPGEHLGEFLDDYEITPYRLAKSIGVQQTRIGGILAGKRSVSADTAIRLGKFFGMSAEYWTGLQSIYDLEIAQQNINLEEIEPLCA